jgi:Protein of unknown function (DUF2934)
MARNGLVELPPGFERPGVTPEDIQVRAYLKWEAAGKPEIDGAAFWLEAERELVYPLMPDWRRDSAE